MKFNKIITVNVIVLLVILSFTACVNKKDASDGVFPNIDNDDIPDILEKTVGTLGDTYFTSFGSSDDKDYQSYLTVTFENTTEDDYAELMAHYLSASTGSDDDDFLLFDWGRLLVAPDDGSISIDAYIK